MKWSKQGLIYQRNGNSDWANNSVLQPTPILLNENLIRVFAGFRDENGRSRVGYVDLDSKNPSKVLKVSAKPVLDIGEKGAFDENGVVPCAIIRRGDDLFLYYAGYQLGKNVRFYVFAGLAVSKDSGETFTRYSRVPVMDRTNEEPLFRVIHSLLYEDNKWRVWYGGGDRFIDGKNKPLPYYDIRYTESNDGISFKSTGNIALPVSNSEHRVGRPYVIKVDDKYRMFFGGGDEEKIYRLAYAESSDGLTWIRNDNALGLHTSDVGWDSQMMAYPAVIKGKENYFLFYNGNNYGYDGFGYAVLENW